MHGLIALWGSESYRLLHVGSRGPQSASIVHRATSYPRLGGPLSPPACLLIHGLLSGALLGYFPRLGLWRHRQA